MLRVRQITRDARALAPEDSLGKAAELLRYSSFSVAPVLCGGQVIGLVSERDLTVGLRNGHQGAETLRVESVMRQAPVTLFDSEPLDSVAEHFQAGEWDALPVLDAQGRYRGMVSRSDIVAAMCGAIRPPLVGGMATPVSVLLTTGHMRGGASNFALALTGALFATTFILIWWITQALLFWLSHYAPVGLSTISGSFPLVLGSWEIANFEGQSALALAFAAVQMLLFLLVIRLTSLAGYHGAEHKVVHAIERGEDLVPEKVRPMPRPHPRCGTNLMVFLTIVIGLWGHIDNAYALMLGVLGWKIFGMKVQEIFTTREPTDKQLRAGIAAGKELLARYNADPSRRVGLSARLWNMGFPQILIGMSCVYLVQYGIFRLIERVVLNESTG